MPNYTVNQIYLGNFGADSLDSIESSSTVGKDFNNESNTSGNWKAEKIIDGSNATFMSITLHDTVRSSEYGTGAKLDLLEEDDYAAWSPWDDPDKPGNQPNTPIGYDSITYDLGDGPVTSGLDTVFNWRVDIKYGDGTVSKDVIVSFMQLQDGSVFTNQNALFTDKNVQWIKLVKPNSSEYFGADKVGRTNTNFKFVCFAAGTMIKTADGECAVESLSAGDQVMTMDSGCQTLRWIGRKFLNPIDLQMNPNLRPVRIRAGALGKGYPEQDLVVSPQHRILVRSSVARRMFDTAEILIAARHLLEIDGIDVAEDLTKAEYFHLMFDRHQIIWSNGAATESMFAGAEALKSLLPPQLDEIYALFPELRDTSASVGACDGGECLTPARYLVPGRKGRRLAWRLSRNGSEVFST